MHASCLSLSQHFCSNFQCITPLSLTPCKLMMALHCVSSLAMGNGWTEHVAMPITTTWYVGVSCLQPSRRPASPPLALRCSYCASSLSSRTSCPLPLNWVLHPPPPIQRPFRLFLTQLPQSTLPLGLFSPTVYVHKFSGTRGGDDIFLVFFSSIFGKLPLGQHFSP